MQGIFYRHHNIDNYALREDSGPDTQWGSVWIKNFWGVRLLMIASNIFCEWIDELITVFKTVKDDTSGVKKSMNYLVIEHN